MSLVFRGNPGLSSPDRSFYSSAGPRQTLANPLGRFLPRRGSARSPSEVGGGGRANPSTGGARMATTRDLLSPAFFEAQRQERLGLLGARSLFLLPPQGPVGRAGKTGCLCLHAQSQKYSYCGRKGGEFISRPPRWRSPQERWRLLLPPAPKSSAGDTIVAT